MPPDDHDLTPRQEAFRDRMIRMRRAFFWFSMAGVVVGGAVAVHLAVDLARTGEFSRPRALILILVLLLARSHLRQHRSSTVIEKQARRLSDS